MLWSWLRASPESRRKGIVRVMVVVSVMVMAEGSARLMAKDRVRVMAAVGVMDVTEGSARHTAKGSIRVMAEGSARVTV